MKLKTMIHATSLVALFTYTPASAQAEPCGPEFNGIWANSFYAEPDYIWMGFKYKYDTEEPVATAASKSGASPFNDDGSAQGEEAFLSFDYNTEDGNLSVKKLNEDTCELSFEQPTVYVDSIDFTPRIVAVAADLSLEGDKLRWCFKNARHMLGACFDYEKVGTADQVYDF